jgi:DNA-directed RNA polymerase subunit K/omega
MNRFEFSVLSGLRAGQLARGCTPRVEGAQKLTVTAQQEIAERKVVAEVNVPVVPTRTADDTVD